MQVPRLRPIISKRLRFAIKLLADSDKDFVDSDGRLVTAAELQGVFENLTNMLPGADERYIELLEHLSPFEIRRPLEFLSRFLVSGHTNMDSLLRTQRGGRRVTIGFHEFFTSILLGDREVYSETSSDIVNVFAVDGRADASNLNRIAVLGRVLKDKVRATPIGVGFLEVQELIEELERIGISHDTVRSILALLNTKRLIETEAQVRDSVGAATFIRATAAAQYYLKTLIFDFAYLDAVVIDTAIGEVDVYERLRALTEQLEGLQGKKSSTRLERLNVRIERAKRFQQYLKQEFLRSTLKGSLLSMDPAIERYFESAEGKLLRQVHDIQDNARQIFG